LERGGDGGRRRERWKEGGERMGEKERETELSTDLRCNMCMKKTVT
jgi:hypothetical protein